MDKRWPWKKKSSEKITTATVGAAVPLSSKSSNGGDQNATKTLVKISAETYAHLTRLEDQVKVLNDKLSTTHSEITAKEGLVKQHAKVAEEAIAGWEKAEAETLALKNELESVTLLKLTVEDRASHLDGALKECMKQIRNVKEESEQKLHDTVFTKTKQWEKVKSELDEKIVQFEQELQRSSAENDAVSRSLQERSNLLMRISDEKSQAESEIEVLKSDIRSCEREINSMKYEVHVISKELEIRNEEKNMSVRLAEAANKHHIEDVKKITKLEAECQRLRGLVRKKLPGPAALAQMKLEVENLGRAYGETGLRKSPANLLSPYLASPPDFSIENIQQCYKENEYLTAQLLAMEEETNMLKEALSKRNSELHTSRNSCSKTASKLRNLETHVLIMNQQKNPLKSNINISLEGTLSQNGSNPSLTSMSEDGIDEEGSCSESWSTPLLSAFSQFMQEKNVDKSQNAHGSKNLELMDDFLEMEKLACLSTETNGASAVSVGTMGKVKGEISSNTSLDDDQIGGLKEQRPDSERTTYLLPHDGEQPAGKFAYTTNKFLTKLQSRITSFFDSLCLETDVKNLLEDVRQLVQDTQAELTQHPAGFISVETDSGFTASEQEHCPVAIKKAGECSIQLKQDANLCMETKHSIDEGLTNAVSRIHDFVVPLCKEAMEIQDGPSDVHVLREKVVEFSATVNKLMYGEINLEVFVCALSYMISEIKDFRVSMLTDKGSERESNSNDFIDKLTLLENRVVQHEPIKGKTSGEMSASDPDTVHVPTSPSFEMRVTSQAFSIEEFEQIKLEKDHIEMNLTRSNETLERSKLQLTETEQHVAELKSILASCQKSNSLADTQLKCMAESYKSLESRSQDLETEINILRSKEDSLDNELQEERRSHQHDLANYKELQDQTRRDLKCSMCSLHPDADSDSKRKQEREISAAAEKLAECQETINLLGMQLKAMHPPAELFGSPVTNKLRMSDLEDMRSPSGYSAGSIFDMQQMEMDLTENDDAASVIQRAGEGESPFDGYIAQLCSSELETKTPIPRPPSGSKCQKNRSRSASSSSISSILNEKQGRGFSRFFSKGKADR